MGKTLVVGSSDIDIFASLKNESLAKRSGQEVSFDLGAKVPVQIKAMTMGGNGANVSVGMKKLGMDVSFYTYLGTDILSKQIEQELEQNGIEVIEDIKRGEKTSLSYILDLSSDRIIFSHHEKRDYGFEKERLSGFESMYLTSIGAEWKEAYLKIAQYVAAQNITLAFSPGSPQLADINEIVLDVVSKSSLLFMNKEEGEKILQATGEKSNDMKELLEKLLQLGPKVVSITDGRNGSFAASDGAYYHIDPFDKNAKGEDKTGAGDSYAAAFLSSYLMGNDLQTCMKWGAVNSNSVMQKVGAQMGLLTKEELEEKLSNSGLLPVAL